MIDNRTINPKEKSEKYQQNILIICIVSYLLINTTRILKFNEIQDTEMEMAFSGQNIITILIGNLILLFSVYFAAIKRTKLLNILKMLWPISLIYVWALLSIIWSDLPFISFKRWIKSIIILLLVINVFQACNPELLLKKTFYYYSWICALSSIILIFIFPEYGWINYQGGYLPCGIFQHKNGLGIFAATMLYILIILNIILKNDNLEYKKPIQNITLYIILLFELILSRGMDVIGGFLLGCGIILTFLLLNMLNKKHYIIPAIFFLSISVFLIISIISDENIIEIMAKKLVLISGKDLTLTGRTDIWAYLLNYGLNNHFYFGCGYDIFFLSLFKAGNAFQMDWIPYHAHNAFMQVFLELGIFGLILTLVIIIKAYSRIIHNWNYNSNVSIYLIAFLTMYLFINMFENIFMGTDIAFFTFICFYCICNRGKYSENKLLKRQKVE